MSNLSFFHIPLSTERLILRPFIKTDAEALFRLNSDPEVLRFTTWKPFASIHDAEKWIDSVYTEQYSKHGYGRLAVTLRENGELIGWSGVKFSTDRNIPTLGYRFMKEYWGKGYATEAGKVSLLHAFHTIGLENVQAFIISGNDASKNVLLKTGFEFSGRNFIVKPSEIRFSNYKKPDRSHNEEPILKSARLSFHEITEEDAAVMYALNCDREVVQYTGDDPFESIAAAKEFLAERSRQYKKHGYGRWKILTDNGECIGWCGLKFHPDKNISDVGYRLFRRYWGKGYASEAAKACIEYGFSVLKLNSIIAHARKENSASVRVLEKCGMKITGEDVDCGGEIFVFEIQRTT